MAVPRMIDSGRGPTGTAWRPLDALAAWPAGRPLLMLHSGGDRAGRWSRWSILAEPRRWLICEAAGGEGGASADPLAMIDSALAATRLTSGAAPRGGPPFRGGWIGFLSWDLGRLIEPTALHRAARQRRRPWPLVALAWCPAALVYDHRAGRWHAVGRGAETLAGPLARRIAAGSEGPGGDERPRVGRWSSSLEPEAYLEAVGRTLEYIAAGDVFQANITQRLRAPFTGSTRRLARRGLARSGAWYGAVLELPGDRTIISMSPELFLQVGRDRSVLTRPVKGTRPAGVDPSELEASAKDTAELNMIVDLMRNDLGRACRPGSVRVPAPRTIETHRTVHHGVGEVTGMLREEVGPAELLRATFPPGSVSGAPKIRAMQIIDELEPVPRGPYCGAIGYFSDSGEVCLSVAIRTMTLAGRRRRGHGELVGGTLDYAVGGGIVADSDPLAEYRECLDKAAALRHALGLEDLRGIGCGAGVPCLEA